LNLQFLEFLRSLMGSLFIVVIAAEL